MAVIIALMVGVIALLAVPLEVSFLIRRELKFDGSVTLRWLFGLVKVRLSAGGESEAGEIPTLRPTRRGSKKSHFDRGILTLLRDGALQRRVLRFVGRVLRAFRIRDVALRLRMGFDDPADTGMLWAVAGPALAALESHPGTDIDLEISFLDACLEGEGRGTVRVIPLELIYVTSLFVVSPPVLSAMRRLLAAR